MRQLLTSNGLINLDNVLAIQLTYKQIDGNFYTCLAISLNPTFDRINIKLDDYYTFKTKREQSDYLKSDSKLACFLRGELGYGTTFDLTPYEHEDNFN